MHITGTGNFASNYNNRPYALPPLLENILRGWYSIGPIIVIRGKIAGSELCRDIYKNHRNLYRLVAIYYI
jgi:hypothetical protein